MVEYASNPSTITDRYGGVLMSTPWSVHYPDVSSFRQKVVATEDQVTSMMIDRAIAYGASLLRKLLDLRKRALLILQTSGEEADHGLEELVSEMLTDLPRLERAIYDDYFSKAVELGFNFSHFEKVVSFLPHTGKTFLEAYVNELTPENAEAVYLWSVDLDRTISDYLSECSVKVDTISTHVSFGSCTWIQKRQRTIPVLAEHCAG